MESREKTPTFNIRVVLQETGIKPHTLRAWERRYGLPQPERTSGGHRLYSQHDIEIIKWLMARQDEGLSISRAVDLWFTLEDEGEDPLATYHAEEQPIFSEAGITLTKVRDQWISKCLDFDEAGAESVLVQAFALYPIKTVCLEVLLAGAAHIGELWHQNKVTVQQEHFVSALVSKRLNALLAALPGPNRSGRILLAAPPNEVHDIPLLLLTVLLRYSGFKVVHLGANVPVVDLESTVDFIKPDLVVLGAQRLATASTLFDVAKFLQQKNVRVGYGGRPFNQNPSLRQHIPAYFLGDNLELGVQNILQIMTFNPPLPEVKPAPDTYKLLLSRYRLQRSYINLDAWQTLADEGIQQSFIFAANEGLSEAIEAALNLGDLSPVNNEILWALQLIQNHDMPEDWLPGYLDAYRQAVDKHLKGSSPISHCLEQVIEDLQETV